MSSAKTKIDVLIYVIIGMILTLPMWGAVLYHWEKKLELKRKQRVRRPENERVETHVENMRSIKTGGDPDEDSGEDDQDIAYETKSTVKNFEDE